MDDVAKGFVLGIVIILVLAGDLLFSLFVQDNLDDSLKVVFVINVFMVFVFLAGLFIGKCM